MTDSPSSDLDRSRASRLLGAADLDGLVLFQPENFAYATGANPGVATMWRRMGGAMALVPSDATQAMTAIVGDLQVAAVRSAAPGLDIRSHRLWVDQVDVMGLDPSGGAVAVAMEGYRRDNQGDDRFEPRPATYDLGSALDLLGDALRDRGLAKARIGADLEFLSVADYRRLTARFPAIDWVDASDIIRSLRSIKTPREIDRLRRACRLSESGLRFMAENIAAGQSRRAVSELWRQGISAAVQSEGIADLSGSWDFVAVGEDPWSMGGTVVPGAIIKADVGCLIGGYSSDMARTYVFGQPGALARDVFAALSDAFQAGIETLRPGVALRDVYAATIGAMHGAGFAGYQRGHFGHGVGASVGSEEWPFIAADSDTLAEPGMVLAFETPFYGRGIGALMIEDQLLVTETGIEMMSTLPRGLAELS